MREAVREAVRSPAGRAGAVLGRGAQHGGSCAALPGTEGHRAFGHGRAG